MTTPISFTVRPPSSTSAPYRPSPLGNGGARGPPSRRLFEQNGRGDDDDDEEEGYRSGSRSSRPRDERIEGFGNGRVIGGDKPEGPLVIPALPNKDWRASSTRRTPSYRPDARPTDEPIETHERTGDEPQRAGLRNILKAEDDDVSAPDGVKIEQTEVKQELVDGQPVSTTTISSSSVTVKAEPLTLEQQALQAILAGDTKQESDEEKLQRELVIDMQSNAERVTPMTEDDAFRRDIDALPEESTIDDYAAIPVSAFGEAMARGMGWTPATQGTKVHEPKLRPALLGLGATALQAPVPPSRSGSSGPGSKKLPKVSKRDSMKYVMTGAMVKKEREGDSGASTPAGSSRRSSPESEGKRRREDDDGRDSKRREGRDEYRDRDRDRDRAKYRDDDRDRGSDRERYREKDRDWEYETDEERARRKAKERERRDREKERGGQTNGHSGRDIYERRDRDRSDRDRDRRDREEYGRDRDRDRNRRERY